MTNRSSEKNVGMIQNAYFEWLIWLVCSGKYGHRRSWRQLFRQLHETEFIYILEMDGNRANDGMELRYRFAYENHIPEQDIDDIFGNIPCSVLEMMIALSCRCENITNEPDSGDSAGKWFFEMLNSLGLSDMDDSRYDKILTDDILTCFMRRKYGVNGLGGLFTVADRHGDVREVEIWTQMMWHLDDTIYDKIYERRK